ncbi:GAF domain-containing sensor histidine kinase [Calothrix sp. 336/3]|uniref:GAF domain-containing sensor histidine kinase n=1 Tax=Calothrix sp. 336/3 TaxID=1337936 RepID=UPI0004E3AAB4|nr:ATP-binding protein [Calothrix sp. 336/3]AKG23892.1 histidine kinase [Calothrix sp. 336/3]
MLISASSEFVTLCREQMALLAQGLGASLSVVYLTQELVEASTKEAQLVPVVVYPEAAARQSGSSLALPKLRQKLLTAAEELSVTVPDVSADDFLPDLETEYLPSGEQIVLPLMYEEMMMGLFVTAREDRAWNEQERGEIERIAQTISLACVLDRRRAWLAEQLHQQQILQEKQQDLLDNLLHQFRNPLTALRTFGKLLMKRLRSGDANREVAVSIVRESDRLQELLQKFEEVIDLTTADLGTLELPSNPEVIVTASVPNNTSSPLLLPGTGEEATNFYFIDILQPLLSSAKAIAQERKLQIKVDNPPNLPQVKGNIKTLQEVLCNIIDNALKYTPAQGKILIQLGQQKTENQINYQGIAISDNGPGIPPEDLLHLGERHYRGVQAQTAIPGTGLGIAIAKQLIGQMQGEIQVFSPALNSSMKPSSTPGTTFIVWLPMVD